MIHKFRWTTKNDKNGTNFSKNDHILYQNNKLLIHESVNNMGPINQTNLIQPLRAKSLFDDFS